MQQVKVLFVCMGNICRSPTAHGVFRKLVEDEGYADRIDIDSAGTHAYHVGEPPDSRATRTAMGRGIDLGDLRARKVRSTDFSEFDYVLAMDRENLSLLKNSCPDEYSDRLYLFLEFAPETNTQEVPDPYYGGESGFDQVFDLVTAGSRGLLADIKDKHF